MARRKYRSRRPRRMRRRRRRKTRIPKTLFGNSRVVKHRYCFVGQQQVGGIQPQGSAAIIESFRLNSPADPNVSTTVFNKPLGFDQMHTLFDNVQVLGAKTHLTFLPSSGAHQQVYWCAIEANTRLGEPSLGLFDILDRRNTTYRYSMQNPGTTRGTQLVRKHSPKRFNSFKDYKDADDYCCVPATQVLDPQFDNFLNFGYSTCHTFTGTPVAPCDYALVITYILRWYDPINPPQS